MKRLGIAITVLLLFVAPSWAQSSALTSATPAATEKKTVEPPADSSSSPAKPTTGKPSHILPPEKAQPVKLVQFAKPPVIDGKLDDEVWQAAPQFKDFYQWRPSDSSPGPTPAASNARCNALVPEFTPNAKRVWQ